MRAENKAALEDSAESGMRAASSTPGVDEICEPGMGRRKFVASLAPGACLFAFAASAQQAKIHRVGMLRQTAPPRQGQMTLLEQYLRKLGYVVGENLILEMRWADGKSERFAQLAAELVALKPDVIVADTTPGSIAVKKATATIPIVMINVSDPVGSGLVASLAHPGGNVTGVADFGTELTAKMIDLIQPLVPGATRVAALMSDNPVHPTQLKLLHEAAQKKGLTILPTMARSTDEVEAAFASMVKRNAGAFIVLGGPPFSTETQLNRLAELALANRLPWFYVAPDRRALVGYGPSLGHRWQMASTYVDRILKGAKPADLPVQQPTEFTLSINLKVANAMGITVPQSLLMRADDIIR